VFVGLPLHTVIVITHL